MDSWLTKMIKEDKERAGGQSEEDFEKMAEEVDRKIGGKTARIFRSFIKQHLQQRVAFAAQMEASRKRSEEDSWSRNHPYG